MTNKKLPQPRTEEFAKEYAQTLKSIKKRIKEAQVKAIMAANRELIELYWSLGEIITEKHDISGWGANVIEELAKDLQNAFPGVSGLSVRNIYRMKSFYEAYAKLPQVVGETENLPIFLIPWGHNALIVEKIKDTQERIWYAQRAIKNGWSRSILEMWIKSDLYRREGKAITNFKEKLPVPESDMAQQTFKDPYLFDFLELRENFKEREIEQGLINHIQKFLLELGQGFAFIGQQVPIEVGTSTYFIDLLFYHAKLHRYIVIELKAREFDHRDAGQISFYLTAVNNKLCTPDDHPTIGLLLCTSKDKVQVEYALGSISNPVGVASFEAVITETLPKEFKGSLPSVQDIELELQKQKAISELEKDDELEED